MNAVTQQEQAALTLPERASVALGSPAHEVKLRELVLASAAIVTVTNKAGRDECHSAYMTLKNTRVNINHTVGDVTEDAKAFTKAVKAEAARLLTITLAEEDRLQKLRDEWDEAEQARKDALIAAERERVESIQKAIQALRDMPLQAVGKSSAEISSIIGGMVGAEPGDSFEEFLDEAKLARFEALEKLATTETAQRGVESEAESRRQAEARAAAEAEEARLAEVARLEAERAENARVAAENARIAAEQKAEAQRLAEVAAAQQAAAQAAQKEADAKASAARAEQDRLDAERQARIDAQLAAIAEQERQLAERQAAADARDAEARAQLEREADHPEALMMNAEFDVAREAELANLAAEEAKRVAQVAQTDLPELIPPVQWLDTLPDPIDVTEELLTDGEIIDLVAEAFALSRSDAIDRLQAIDCEAARAAA